MITEVSPQPIVAYGCPILRETCQKADNNELANTTIKQLIITMDKMSTAVGLAAPQINQGLQMFAMRAFRNYPIEIIINPLIVKRRATTGTSEGCLSIPDVFCEGVKRDDIIDVEYFDKDFNKVKKRYRGWESIIFQHEYDHLYGILYVDRLSDNKLEEIRDKLERIEEGRITTYYPMLFNNKNK